MDQLFIACVVLVVAVAVNSTSVYAQKRHHFYTRKFGSHDQFVHSLVILPAWIFFADLVSRLQASRALHFDIIDLSVVGVFLAIAAVALFISSIRTIGSGALVNANFFKPQQQVSGGVYRYLKNPIYDSYALLFLGLGLIYSNWAYLVLSVLIWLLLIGVESKIEYF